MVAVSLWLILRLRRSAGTEAARLPMSVLMVQVGLGVAFLVIQMATDALA